MIEIYCDIWQELEKYDYDALCVTTNGFVKKDYCAVMGRGIALQVKDQFPGIDKKIGLAIKTNGNKVNSIMKTEKGYYIVTFPVKEISGIYDGNNVVEHAKYKYKIGDFVPGFHLKADFKLIKKSAMELMELVKSENWKKVILPRPGCGAGERYWFDVYQIIKDILDERIYIISKE